MIAVLKRTIKDGVKVLNFVYDEDYEYYVCDMDLDEDEMYRFLSGSTDSCPYYQLDNEYLIVRKQM